MCARIIPASVLRFCIRDDNPFAKGILWRINGKRKKIEVLMHTICDNFSFFFTPINILVIHLFVCQLSGWSSPRFVLPFQNVQAGEPTHPCRLAHWRPFQEMMWWCYLLQVWLCLYFWLNLHWKPASSAIVFLYLLWFHVVCTSLLSPGHLLCSVHKNNYYTDRLFCALSAALFCHEVCTSHKSFQTLLCLMVKWSLFSCTFSKVTLFACQDLFIYSVCCEMS